MEAFYNLSTGERIALCHEARRKNEPLMIRWAKVPPNFGMQWNSRTVAAAAWLKEAASVVDLGCGSMNLQGVLRRDQTYMPVDVIRRDDRTLVLDLNKSDDLERLPNADACALLGVLEYCYIPEELMAALYRLYGQVVVTFNFHRADQDLDGRLEHGWVNHFTRDQTVQLFYQHGFELRRKRLFKGKRHECLFDLRRRAA